MTAKIKTITVVGAGTMGNGIAHVCAQHGYPVTLLDIKDEYLQHGLKTIKNNLARQVAKELISEADADAAISRIVATTDLKSAVAADLVIEAATENTGLKLKLFADLASNANTHTILASNTSSISITLLAGVTDRPEQVIGMHFMNPVPMMKLVEIIRGHDTSDTTHDIVIELTEALGKTPVSVNDYPGFVANRVLMPMINEAVFCLLEGVAEAEAIDTIMKLGMNHPMGPLALADLIGLDTCLSIMEVLHTQLGDDKYRPCPLLRKMVAAGALGRKAGRGFYKYEQR